MSDDEIGVFEHLYREHVNAVFAYALARTTPDLAMEAVEETFLVAWRRLDDLPTEPRAWLFGVARRVLANQRRARNRRTALGVRIAASHASEHHGSDPAEIVVERDTALVALGRLPEADRELLCLIAWGGLSPGEAARVLGCSKPTLIVRFHRARRRFDAEPDDDDLPGPARSPATIVHAFPPNQPSLSKEII